MNVNMVTCGGQATIPMVAAVSRVQRGLRRDRRHRVQQVAGPGTRKNIDEFTRTTAGAVERWAAPKGQGHHHHQPGRTPLMMRDTVHCLVEGEPKQDEIRESIAAMIKEVQKYVPGYRLVNGPVFDGNRVSVFLEVEGLGDYLPKYAGNLDIMTAAAARTAEMFAEEILAGSRRRPRGRLKENNMDLKGKKITVHDMTLRDGMHPKRHQMSLEQMKSSPPASTPPACR
jgi:acetaldehyde/propanal dehydrogenase